MNAKRILIVENKTEVLEHLDRSLTRAGYEVEGVTSARAALQRVGERSFDALLMDCKLPDMNCVILHRQLSRVDSRLGRRTAIISGGRQSQVFRSYFASHGVTLFIRPFAWREALSAIRDLLPRRQQSFAPVGFRS